MIHRFVHGSHSFWNPNTSFDYSSEKKRKKERGGGDWQVVEMPWQQENICRLIKKYYRVLNPLPSTCGIFL